MLSKVPPYDASQWSVVEGPLTCEVRSVRYSQSWNVGYKLLKQVFAQLDKQEIDLVLDGPCSCKKFELSCSSKFHPLDFIWWQEWR